MKWQLALKDYQNYLRIERGLSVNSITNYALDIKKLIHWLDTSKIHETPISISADVVQQFIYTIAKNVNPRPHL
jgi:integrase/recombinase XerD